MKKFTKHILLLALMLFGAAGAAWALPSAPQKYTSAVNLSVLQVGDTLAEGASITYDIGNNNWNRTMEVTQNRAKKNGFLVTDFYGEGINIDCTIGAGGVIINGSDSFTPVTQSGDDGDAWVVTSREVDGDEEFIDIEISGVLLPAPAPSVPTKDQLTGNWNFLMPGSNKVVKAVLYDSIVLGPNVSYVTADPVIPPANRYTRGDSTIIYYEPGSLASVTIAAAETDGNGKFFAYWADLATTDPQYTTPNRYVYSAEIVCGNRYVAAYPELYTLTLNANQGGTLTLDGYTPSSVNGWTINVSNIGATGGDDMSNVSAFQITTVTLLASNNEVVGSGNLNAASGTIQIQTSGTATQVRFGFSWHNNEYNEDYSDIITASVSAVSGQQLYEEGDLLAVTAIFTCTPAVTPAVTPFGITANNNGSFNVMEGLTVNVTATPDSAHYLSSIDEHDTVGNHATGYSFTMPSEAKNLTANFETKPVLTVNDAQGGTLEAIVPSAEPVLLTTIYPTSQAISTGTQTNDTVTVTVAGDLEWGSGGWIVQYGDGKHGSVTVTAAPGFDIAYYKFYISEGNPYIVSEETAAVYPYCSGSSQKIYTRPNGQGQSKGYGSVTRIEVYTPTRPTVIAASTPNTYIIDYGTDVTVKATPGTTQYLVDFDGTDVRNDNDTATKTYTGVTESFTSTAHFTDKPVLTLSHNIGGTNELNGYSPAGLGTNQWSEFPSGWAEGSSFDHVLGTDMPQDFQAVGLGTARTWQNTTGKQVYLIYAIEGGNAKRLTFYPDGSHDQQGGDSYRYTVARAELNNRLVYYTTGEHPEVFPEGVIAKSANGNIFTANYGATVTVTATPDSAHYLATLGGVTHNSNTAVDSTFTVTGDVPLAANFATKPTLTLAHNDGGEMEVIPAGSATAMHLTTDQIPTWSSNNEPVMEADLQPFGFVAVDSAAAAAWTGAPASGVIYLLYAPAGNKFKVHVFQNGQWSQAYSANYSKGSIYGNLDKVYFTTGATSNVTASTEPNTYYIDYNTSVTVKATPSDTAYLVRFVGDADTNSNTAVEKTYGPLTAALTTAEATFNDKPVLTLAQNESWGSVSVSGPVVWNNQVWGSWDSFTSFPQTIGDITINKNNFYCYYSSGKLLLSRSVDNNSYVTFTSAGDNFTRIEMTYTGGSNLEPANEWTCENGVAVWEGDAQSVTITNATDFYFTQIKFIRGSGIAQLTDNTYRVDYGTTLTVKADATELHHIANWVNEDSVDYPAADITYSAYFITEPVALFPDSSTLTLTVTADTMAKAVFGINYRNLLFSHNDGGHMEFVVEQDSMLFAGIATTNVTRDDITITAGQADGDGMYLKDGVSTINIAIEGGANITQVDFHVTNGTNLVNTIGVDAEGATITTTANNEYGSIKNLNTPSLTISSSTTHDLQIDQFIVHYGNALPSGVAYGPNDSTWYVMPDSTVIVRAVPDNGHYLVSWNEKDNISVLDTLTVSMTVTEDDTLHATFAPYPVLTLAVSDAAMGSAYFTGYHGKTVTRAGIIKAQSIDLPYRWYEASEIMNIVGSGMVTKDATSHYLIVNGIFDGTDTVVTSTGAFTVTCEPTLPNGVRYNIAEDNYTINPYTELSLTATPNPGHYFVDWAKVVGEDSTLYPDEATKVFRIDGDMKLQANFLHNPYILTLVADAVMGSIDTLPGQAYVSANTQALTQSSNQTIYTVMADSTVTIVANANTGYHITGWSNNAEVNSLTSDTIQVTIVSDSTITVTLAGNPVVTLADSSNGTVIIDSLPEFAVDNQNGTYSVLPGTVLSFTSTPDTHYYMTRWNDSDSMINSNVAVTRTDTINADTTIGASFAHKPILTLTVNNTNGGSAIVMQNSAVSEYVDVSAASEVQIGDETRRTYYFPIDNYFNHSFTEQIYTADEIDTAGTINSISFYYHYGNPYTASNVTMYLKHVSKSYFLNSSDCEPVSTNDIVWTGNIAPTGEGWYTFTLDTPFEYNGTDNLMVVFFDPTSGYPGTSYTWRATTSPNEEKRAIRYYSDSAIPDPYDIANYGGSKQLYDYRTNIKINIVPRSNDNDTVVGTYVVDYNKDVTMKAVAKTGYNFLRWEGPNGQVYGTDSVLTISPMVTDTLVHAVFDTNRYNLVVNIAEGDEDFGSVEGSVSEALHFEEYTIEATADSGYHFVVWSDGDSNASRTVTLTSDSTFTATFDTNSYRLHVVVADSCEGFGTVEGDTVAKHFLTYGISATANPGYHFVMWSDGDSNAARTVELTGDSTIAAIFAYNPSLTIEYDGQNGHVEFIVETQTATFTGIQTASLSDGGVSVSAESADGSGMSMKNGKTITIATDGSSVITQVAFHLTNGTNKASTIVANAGIVNAANGDAYGAVTDVRRDTVVISSTSDKDINIDQLTIQYRRELPVGVVHLEGSPANVYHVERDTTVRLLAVPADSNYLEYWAGDTTSTSGLTAVVAVADEDVTVEAKFSGNPLLTLKAVGVGRVYFEGYSGYTINRNEEIKATNQTEFPYTWYEVGTINEITGGDGMVTKDNTEHYISVHGPFNGTATVVTTSGSFNVTCIPTVPNGVAVMALDTFSVEPGTVLTVNAVTDEEHYLLNWDDLDSAAAERTVTVNSNTSLVAHFLHMPYTLTLEADATMGSIDTLPGQAYVSANTQALTQSSNQTIYTVMADSTVTVVATPHTGYHLAGWSHSDTLANTVEITMVQDSLVSVTFDTNTYDIDIAVAEECDGMGSVSTTPDSLNHFLSTTSIATAAEGYHFTGWQNEAGTVVEENDTLELSPVSDTAVYATFDTNAYRVDVLVAGASNGMGEVEAEPDTVLHFLSARYAATPAEGYRFMGWQNEAGTVVEENDTIEIAPISDTVVYAVFDTSVYLLVVHAADSSMGSVAGTDSAAKHFVEYTVSATAEPGFHFVSWNDGDTVNPRTVSPTMDTAFTAIFDTTHAELAWSADTFTCYTMIDANNWRPTLDNPNGVEVRYGCVEGTVPVVDTTGVIGSEMNPGHIIGTTGVYHIYAVHATTNDFFYDSVVYVLNVEQGVTVFLSKNIDDGGTARFTDQDSLPTLTHVYGTSTMAFVAHGDSVTVEATPATGYNFSAWQTGNNNDGWNNLSTASEYTFIIPEDTALAALRAAFDTIVYGVTVAVAADCEGFGSVNTTPASVKHFLSGRYIATPAEGYIFTGWQNEAGTVVEDNDTIDIWPVSDTAVYATFDTNTHHLAVAVADTCEGFGTVEGDTVGKHFLGYEIAATPATCYHFVKWSDGVTDNPRTVELTSDSTIYAQFAYTVRKGYDTIEICDTAEWNDSIYTVSGDYSKLLGTTEHCDSTAMLHLTIKNSTFSVEDTTVCESYTWNNVDYFTTTVAFYYTKNAVDCDSTAQLNLTVNNATESRETVVTCDSVYKWNDFTYTTSTLGIYHTTNQYGCDSTATLDLTLNHNFTGVDEQQHCESYTWVNGVTYNESTDTPTYVYHELASNGCDSTVTLHLTISNTINVTENVTACDSYEWHDSVYTSSTSEPSYTSSSVAGCDSIVTLNLTINNSVDTSFDAATCSYYIWDGSYYNENGSYTKHYTGTNNCDSTVTMNLSVNTYVHTDFRDTACGSYIWNGIEYTASGAYTQSFTGTNNCDSTVTLMLTVKQPTAATVAVIAGSSYEWNGTTYTQSGNYTYTTTGSNGCDSVTTLQLTLNDAVNGSMTMTACNSYTWNGQTYSESGDYTYSHLDNYGNTQVDTLHLTIKKSVATSFDTIACDHCIWDGTYYNEVGSYTKHYTAVNGCDSAVTMNLAINDFITTTETVTACDSYEWHDSVYTRSTSTPTYTTNAVNGCDSTVTLHLTVKQSTASTETVTACGEYEWHGTTYTSSTSTPSYTSTGVNGCDSTVTLNLTINQPVYSTETVTACDEYLWHDSLYTSSTSTTSYTSTGVNGCDSTVTLNLTVKESVQTGFDTAACEYYIWDGTFHNQSGSYTKHYTALNGCDSASTMNLTINHPVTTDTSVSSCGSYAWNGVSYNASGAYQRKFTGSNGCDSTVNLTLTVKHATTAVETVNACDSYTWHGTEYTASTNIPTYTTEGSNGCDSTVTLHLTIGYATTAVETVNACDSYTWHGTEYTASTNTPTYSTTNAAGCDSTVTLNLTVKESVATSADAEACVYYIWDGTYYNESGSYTKHYTAANGCDSAATLNLTVNQPVTTNVSQSACVSYNWNGTEYNASGAYQQKFTAGNGCDSTVNLTLTVKQPTAATVVASACDSYEWNGTTYTETPAVAPTYTTTGSNGCDSVTTLQLVVAHSGSEVDNVTACDSYTWINGVTYTESTNTPTHTITGSGCNVTVTLNLTIKNSVQTDFDNTACDSYTWDGTYYNETGSYTKHYTAVNGCDSAATMNLTVNHPVYTTETVVACVEYLWNDSLYTSSTSSASYTSKGINGCDSTVTLNLTVKQSTASTETVTACDSYEWHGTVYDGSTVATYTTTGVNNCDSTVTLNLTVNQPVSTTETVVACGEYEWHGTTYTASTNTPTYQTTGVNGCDSTVTLNLTVKESIETSFDTAACIYCIWDGAYYDRSGSYTKHYTALNGCDSASTMNLTVNNPTSTTETVTACGSYFWNSIEYTASGAYQQGFVGSNGCDSSVTLTLTIKQPVFTTETVAACDSYEWNGEEYTASTNTPTYTTEGSNGCDSTVTLNLTVKNSVYTTETVAACDSYEWNGEEYNASGSYLYTTTGVNGCDSTVTLNLTVKNSVFTTETETVCDSYDWNGELRTATGEYSYTTTAANGCDSTVTLTLTVKESVETVLNETACEGYLWNGTEYIASGSYQYNTTAANGCDSTVTLNLTVNQPVFTSETATACDSYEWNGDEYNASGSYLYTTTGVNGCDSTVTLTLTIKNSVQTSFETAACGYYIWDGAFYNQSGSYTKHYTAANGCDSTATLTLTVNQPVTASVTETACGSYTWNGIEYTASGAYTRIFTGNNGCDSTVTLTLTVKQPVYTTETVTACDEYLWHDSLYTSSTSTTSYTSTGSNGCDSTVTLNLTVKHSTTGVETVEACDSYEWHGTVYVGSTDIPTYTTTNAAGCDSTVTLHLTVNQSSSSVDNVTACDSYEWHGTVYDGSTVATYTTTGSNGCDSTVTLNLTVNQSSSSVENITACGSYTWHGTVYDASAVATYTTTGVNGCDSTVTLNLTVNQPVYTTETVTACGEYEWHGTTYTSSTSTPSYTSTGVNGCDSTVTLNLTVSQPVFTSEDVEACGSYEWNGTVYTASGSYTFTTTSVAGCDSTATLNLTVNNPVHTSETAVACGSHAWNGTVYTESGDYTYSHLDANGCTQVDTLHLTIGSSVYTEETVTTCDSYEWNGRVYTESGDYTYSTTTATGCDSTVTLHLTVNHSAQTSFDTLCYGTFVWNGETFSESGTYERTLTTVTGCDSVVTVNLVILPEGFVMPYLYNLMDVMLTINHNEEGMEEVRYVWYRWYRNGEMVLEGPDKDSYSEGGSKLNGCYYLEVAVDESMEYWVRSNEVCINAVGIDDVKELSFTLAPNPAMHNETVTVSVEAGSADLQGSEIRVYDVQGRIVLTVENTDRFEAPLATGMYMVRLTLADGRSVVKRLIVK